ncbi:MAG: flagellar motor protein MotB, partial [Cellulosilyticaceae bacterium]
MRRKKQKKENNERWLLTYSDLITLLMIFFVVMYTMSSVDSQKYAQLANSLSGSFSGTSYVVGDGGTGNINPGSELYPPDMNTTTSESTLSAPSQKAEQIQEAIKVYLETHKLQSEVDMTIEPRGLVISLKENAFFESGKADILPKYEKNILEISKMLDELGNDIVVEGHTDNEPIHNSRFESNWELAAMRAINVIDLLTTKGDLDPNKLSAVSYGEYRPTASNDTAAGRAQNRRIDIVLLSS